MKQIARSHLVFIQRQTAAKLLGRVAIVAFRARVPHSLVFGPFLDGHAIAATGGRDGAAINRAQAVRRVSRQSKRGD